MQRSIQYIGSAALHAPRNQSLSDLQILNPVCCVGRLGCGAGEAFSAHGRHAAAHIGLPICFCHSPRIKASPIPAPHQRFHPKNGQASVFFFSETSHSRGFCAGQLKTNDGVFIAAASTGPDCAERTGCSACGMWTKHAGRGLSRCVSSAAATDTVLNFGVRPTPQAVTEPLQSTSVK